MILKEICKGSVIGTRSKSTSQPRFQNEEFSVDEARENKVERPYQIIEWESTWQVKEWDKKMSLRIWERWTSSRRGCWNLRQLLPLNSLQMEALTKLLKELRRYWPCSVYADEEVDEGKTVRWDSKVRACMSRRTGEETARMTATWELKFNASECCILNFGKSNNKLPYKVSDNLLKASIKTKTMALSFPPTSNSMKMWMLWFSKLNRQFGIIIRIFKQKTSKLYYPT